MAKNEKAHYLICTQVIPDGLGDITLALNAAKGLKQSLENRGIDPETYDIKIVFDKITTFRFII